MDFKQRTMLQSMTDMVDAVKTDQSNLWGHVRQELDAADPEVAWTDTMVARVIRPAAIDFVNGCMAWTVVRVVPIGRGYYDRDGTLSRLSQSVMLTSKGGMLMALTSYARPLWVAMNVCFGRNPFWHEVDVVTDHGDITIGSPRGSIIKLPYGSTTIELCE